MYSLSYREDILFLIMFQIFIMILISLFWKFERKFCSLILSATKGQYCFSIFRHIYMYIYISTENALL